jgi:hypothetical protein
MTSTVPIRKFRHQTMTMNTSKKMTFINVGIVLSILLPFVEAFLKLETDVFTVIGTLSLGAIFTFFNHEVAAERYRINQETKNPHLKKFYAGKK